MPAMSPAQTWTNSAGSWSSVLVKAKLCRPKQPKSKRCTMFRNSKQRRAKPSRKKPKRVDAAVAVKARAIAKDPRNLHGDFRLNRRPPKKVLAKNLRHRNRRGNL